MGVPAFFRWLSRKYNGLVVHCVEEKSKIVNDVRVPVDTSLPNPNDTEFDNLYLDMNGIIHPCCHPENKPAPKNEDEMMVLIFEYIDRIFSICRPRRLLYMAIDGVAPRAKMNQQRSRRFRASKETAEKIQDMARIKGELRAKGLDVPPDKPAGEHFDSNCITPGTPFMHRLAECLRYYIHDRLNNDPGWAGIKVILSDANVPGEGEHKIMDYIRRQRAQPDHDPNTHHCLCGADADLIMLGLATHEPNFTIIREEFKPNQPRPCDICGQVGHEMKECQGAPKKKEGEFDELPVHVGEDVEFIFIRLCILREYLEDELKMTNLPFEQDIERAIDDWVFMCFFVGNDFLPHLPSLEIREGAIDRLVRLYKSAVYKTGGYLTKSGLVNIDRVQLVLSELGKLEDEIFKKRRSSDLAYRRREKEKKQRENRFANANVPSLMLGGQYAPQVPGRRGGVIANPRQTAAEMRVQSANYSTSTNQQAANALRSMMSNGSEQQGQKRKHEETEDDEPADEVKLWEDGFKDRYYESKFSVGKEDIDFRHTVANEYVLGLCWVLRYYYQGCASWKWYFPYHYAPFASDFVDIANVNTDFEKDTKPFNPLEQLMGVFPAASKKHLPYTWQDLMENPESNIIDFYPVDFKIDLNGKKYAWQGVALLPFVDEQRLKKELQSVYPDLTPDEKFRNTRGNDRLFVGKNHPAHDFFEALYENGISKEEVEINSEQTKGVRGLVWCDDCAVLSGGTIKSPLPALEDQKDNRAIAVHYKDPQFDADYIFPAVILKGAVFPERTIKKGAFDKSNPGGYRPQLGFTRDSHHRGRGTYSNQSANRMVRGNLSSGGGQYGNVPPPASRGYDNRRDNRSHGQSYGGNQSQSQGGSRWNQGQGGGNNRNYGNQGGGQNYQQSSGRSSAYSQYQQQGYGGRGGNQGSYNQGGYNQGGYNQGGYNQGGYNQGGYNQGGGGGYGGRSGGGGGGASGRGGRSHPGYGMVGESTDNNRQTQSYGQAKRGRY